jgi:hypothetical protein
MKVVDLRKEKMKNIGLNILGVVAIGLELYAAYLWTFKRHG